MMNIRNILERPQNFMALDDLSDIVFVFIDQPDDIQAEIQVLVYRAYKMLRPIVAPHN